jgi:hypothetical protein
MVNIQQPVKSQHARTQLSGGRLIALRITWLFVALWALTIFVVGLRFRWSDLQTIFLADYAEALQEVGVSVQLLTTYAFSIETIFALVLFGIGSALIALRSDDWLVGLVSLALVTGAVAYSDFSTTLRELYPAWHVPVLLLRAVAFSAVMIAMYLFPDGRFVPHWTKYLAAIWILNTLSWLIAPPALRKPAMNSLSDLLPFGLMMAFFGTVVIAQMLRRRRTRDAIQRQQTKWVVYGFLGFFIIMNSVWAPVMALPALRTPSVPSMLYEFLLIPGTLFSIAILPISIGFSIVRYRLWDIDVLVNRTLVYGTLSATLLIIYGSIVFALQSLFRSVTGQGNDLAIVASTLAISALFNPLRGRIQAAIDRRFYRSKYDAARALTAFSDTMQDKVNIEDLNAALLRVVDESMQPAHLSIWLRTLGH